ncbi:MAG: hypothetical protein AAFO84_15390 [Cyanobacteria bacterium J06598_1]
MTLHAAIDNNGGDMQSLKFDWFFQDWFFQDWFFQDWFFQD